MSGSFQHHIPQFFLRGFRAHGGSKKQSKTWLFEKGSAARLASIKSEVGAEDFFYSRLPTDGSQTLDERITEYETQFALSVQRLKDAPPGIAVDPTVAAEVVAHLTIRNAHLRHTFGDAVKSLVNKMAAVFGNEMTLRTLIGVDDKSPSLAMKECIDELLAENPICADSGIPKDVLYQMAQMMLREQYHTLFIEHLPDLLLMFEVMIAGAPQAMREGHNKALASGLTPDGRTELLKKFDWVVCSAQDEGFILPDCIALCLDRDGDAEALIVADLKETTAILMPLSSTRMLVGTTPESRAPRNVKFNDAAARWSYNFFVAAKTCPEFENLARTISTSISAWVERTISPAVEELLRERGLPVDTVREPPPVIPDGVIQATVHNAQQPSAPQVPMQYSVHFQGCADQPTAEKIASVLNEIAIEFSYVMPLDRLDGVTFAYDYPAVLRDLDRGLTTTAPLQPTNEEYGVGIAMAALVLRDGTPKKHIVLRGDIGHYLISENEDDRRFALHIVVQQLAHAASLQILDESLPGVVLGVLEDPYAAFLYPYADSAWGAYFGSRASASFYPEAGKGYAELLVAVLKRATKDIPEARVSYRFHGDLDRLLRVALPRIADILHFSGKVLGHCDGLSQPILDDANIAASLHEAGLRDWFAVFDDELSSLWHRRGGWASFEESLLLNRNVERLLWQFGLIPWKMDDGRIWVEVPLGTDADKLASQLA